MIDPGYAVSHGLIARTRDFLAGGDRQEKAVCALASALHAEMPPVFPLDHGLWVARSHAAVKALASSASTSIDPGRLDARFRAAEVPEIDRAIRASLVLQDPPEHTRLRRIIAPFFTRRRLKALAQDTAGWLEQKLQAAERAGECLEFVQEIAEPMILETTRRVMGWQAAPLQKLHRWSHILAAQIMRFGQSEEDKTLARDAFAQFGAFLAEERERRRRHNRRDRAKDDGDLYDALLAAEEDGAIADSDELTAQCLLLLVNGMETGPTFLAALVHRLLEEEGRRADLRTHPEGIAGFLEESLRCDGSVPMIARVTVEDSVLDGVAIPRGAAVIGLVAIANRDGQVFAEPGRFDPKRRPNPHLSLGAGPHRCLGNALIRLHGAAVLHVFSQLTHPPRLPPDATRFHHKPALRGPQSLSLQFEKARRHGAVIR